MKHIRTSKLRWVSPDCVARVGQQYLARAADESDNLSSSAAAQPGALHQHSASSDNDDFFAFYNDTTAANPTIMQCLQYLEDKTSCNLSVQHKYPTVKI